MPKIVIFREKSIQVGMVQSLAGNTVPPGFLLCDGSIVSRTEYKELFDAIGTLWGSGDGSTTFHLPDFRGRLLRGVDKDADGNNATGRDVGRNTRAASNAGGATGNNVGTVQGNSYQQHNHGSGTSHTHTYAVWDTRYVVSGSNTAYPYGYSLPNRGSIYNNNGSGLKPDSDVRKYRYWTDYSGNLQSSQGSGSENRSKNVAVKFMIKV
jgi:microcystin-dependent protein